VTALSGHLWADDPYGKRGGQASSGDLLPLGYGEGEWLNFRCLPGLLVYRYLFKISASSDIVYPPSA